MYQFFTDRSQIDVENHRVYLTGPDVNHIKNVLRMRQGEEISVSNGEDETEYRCGILEFEESRIVCELRFIRENHVELASRIYLFQGLPKADKMEFIVQKAVELGVFQIIPMSAKRCVVRLDEKKAQSKIQRWQQIAQAAAKQSRRAVIPQVSEILSFHEAVQYGKDMDVRLIPYELANDMEKTKRLISGIQKDQKIAVFIGPEGGFEDSEIQLALEAGIEPVTLGKRILRTETAGMTILSWMMYQLEE